MPFIMKAKLINNPPELKSFSLPLHAFRQTGARVPAWECCLRAILIELFAPGLDIGPRRKTFGKNRPPSPFGDGSLCACLAKKGRTMCMTDDVNEKLLFFGAGWLSLQYSPNRFNLKSNDYGKAD